MKMEYVYRLLAKQAVRKKFDRRKAEKSCLTTLSKSPRYYKKCGLFQLPDNEQPEKEMLNVAATQLLEGATAPYYQNIFLIVEAAKVGSGGLDKFFETYKHDEKTSSFVYIGTAGGPCGCDIHQETDLQTNYSSTVTEMLLAQDKNGDKKWKVYLLVIIIIIIVKVYIHRFNNNY
jgi:hypothetical protein